MQALSGGGDLTALAPPPHTLFPRLMAVDSGDHKSEVLTFFYFLPSYLRKSSSFPEKAPRCYESRVLSLSMAGVMLRSGAGKVMHSVIMLYAQTLVDNKLLFTQASYISSETP